MPFTRTTFLRIIRVGSAVVIIILIASYALWRSFNYARGPHITILEPADGATISESTTHIKGIVERANNITLNGKAISIDEQGNFSETIIVFPGMNVITLQAHDQFERTIETRIRVMGM